MLFRVRKKCVFIKAFCHCELSEACPLRVAKQGGRAIQKSGSLPAGRQGHGLCPRDDIRMSLYKRNDLFQSRRFKFCEVRKNFPVEFHILCFECRNELTIAHSFLAHRRVDFHIP